MTLRASWMANAASIAFALLFGLATTGSAPDSAQPGESGPRPPAPAALPPDSVIIWGPFQFDGKQGQGNTYIEAFSVPAELDDYHKLLLVNGAPDGTRRASKVIITLNGVELVSKTDVSQSLPSLSREVLLNPADTIVITVAGSGNPYITLSVSGRPDPYVDVSGPHQVEVLSGNSRTVVDTFALPAGVSAPHRVEIRNGAGDGSDRVNSASVALNGTTVVTTSELDDEVGSLMAPVSFAASNIATIVANGPVGSYVTVTFVARDFAAPILLVTTPATGTYTTASTAAVSGTISDQTAVTVEVEGQPATVVNNSSFSATTPLAEGSNSIFVTASDAAGGFADTMLIVTRDSYAPSLAVTGPPDGTGTADSMVQVTGTATDASPLTVTVNGAPVTLDGAGAFAAPVPLTYGANVLTTTALDAAGNSISDVRTVTRDSLAPLLTVTSPLGGASVPADSVEVSGTVSDDNSVTVTVNGIPLSVDAGAFSGMIALAPGENPLVVVAQDGASNSTAVSRMVYRDGVIPPDPASLAPPLDQGVATTMVDAVEFLYTGPGAIQEGVAPGTMDPLRVAVLRGRLTEIGRAHV